MPQHNAQLVSECRALIASGKRVAAVKKYRAATGATLVEARRVLDDKRPLRPEDVPAIKWDGGMDRYFLREDGAIVCEGMSVELGWLDGQGGVNWVK